MKKYLAITMILFASAASAQQLPAPSQAVQLSVGDLSLLRNVWVAQEEATRANDRSRAAQDAAQAAQDRLAVAQQQAAPAFAALQRQLNPPPKPETKTPAKPAPMPPPAAK